MADTAAAEAGRLRCERAVELRVAARLENLAVLRTLVGAAGALADLDLDTVADLRLAVDEACTELIGAASPGATLVVVVEPDEDAFVVRASTRCDTGDVLAPGGFSWHVLTSLVDDARVSRGGDDGGIEIVLTTYQAGAAR